VRVPRLPRPIDGAPVIHVSAPGASESRGKIFPEELLSSTCPHSTQLFAEASKTGLQPSASFLAAGVGNVLDLICRLPRRRNQGERAVVDSFAEPLRTARDASQSRGMMVARRSKASLYALSRDGRRLNIPGRSPGEYGGMWQTAIRGWW